jgi:hypothetical protein
MRNLNAYALKRWRISAPDRPGRCVGRQARHRRDTACARAASRKRLSACSSHDGTWSYFEDTILMVKGQVEPLHHTDRNTLSNIAESAPDALAQSMRGIAKHRRST